MASVKIILAKHKKKKDGIIPLAIRFIKDRKPKYIWTQQYIKETDWDEKKSLVKKSHPNSARLNNFLLKKLSEANDTILDLETGSKSVSTSTIKKHLKSSSKERSIFALAETYFKNLEQNKKYSRLSAEKPRIKRLKEFVQGEDLDFRDIDVLFLQRFQAWLKATRNIKQRTITNHLIVIRTLFNLAIYSNIVEQKFYPFGKGKISIKFAESEKIGLSKEEINTLENFELESPAQRHALNVWLFCYYFAGMRVSDALRIKWSDIQDDRLYYQMGKNSKTGSLKIPEKALRIIEQYDLPEEGNQTIFPELNYVDLNDTKDVYRKINNADHKFNEHLSSVAQKANINKKLTMHIARHTFGNISGDKIHPRMLQKLYRHSSILTTMNYQQHFIHESEDEALESVIG